MNRRTFSILCLAAVPVWAAAQALPPSLSKTWTAVTRPGMALGGSIVLGKKGELSLEPEGHDPVKGTWKVEGRDTLVFDVPEADGVARVQFKLEKGKLYLTYENGEVQEFKAKAPKAQQKK